MASEPSLPPSACPKLKIDSNPYVYPIPRMSDWMEIKSFPNIIPEHADSWENDEVMYNMEIADTDVILQEIIHSGADGAERKMHAFVRAGPRSDIVFHGPSTRAAIVTCGGLCPGINNVIRDIVLRLSYNYGVKQIYGIQNGYQGFYKEELQPPVELTPAVVASVHNDGGTFLGTSRGGFEKENIIQGIIKHKYDVIFCIGGDGTLRGATTIFEETRRLKLPVAICVIPKTIDNDIPYVDKTFGFQTAVEEAQRAIKCAKVEARCDRNSIAIVQLMGRAAGFIAVHAALASGDVDCVLVPEVPFDFSGPKSICTHLKNRVLSQGHAVVVVAEGAGTHLLEPTGRFDASGNPVLPEIGSFLKSNIAKYFREELKMPVSVRFIDPSYMIRSVPANADDSMYCMLLASQAVHGVFAGLTGFTVGLVNNRTVYIPNDLLKAAKPRRLNSKGRMWERVVMMTRQPRFAVDSVVRSQKPEEQ